MKQCTKQRRRSFFFASSMGIYGCLLFLVLATTLLAGTINIEQADEAQINLIQDALGEKYPISKAVAVRSYNHGRAYYVGAVFHAVGAGDLTGVWFVGGDKKQPKSVYSVDGNAYHFSGLSKASETKVSASTADPEARAVKKHLEKSH